MRHEYFPAATVAAVSLNNPQKHTPCVHPSNARRPYTGKRRLKQLFSNCGSWTH